jgi:hypothetical protein
MPPDPTAATGISAFRWVPDFRQALADQLALFAAHHPQEGAAA